MDAKNILKGYLTAKREKERWERLLEETEAKIMSINIDYSKEKVQSTPTQDRIADVIDTLSDIRNRCIEMAYQESVLMGEVLTIIDSVDDAILKDVLQRRYIEGHTWEQIAFEMKYSWRGIHNLHTKALKKVKECIEVHT